LIALEYDDRDMNFCTIAWFTARPIQATVFPRTTVQNVILLKGEGLNLKKMHVSLYFFTPFTERNLDHLCDYTTWKLNKTAKYKVTGLIFACD
jgi:hypothetical protein